jgi:hypothetical protein
MQRGAMNLLSRHRQYELLTTLIRQKGLSRFELFGVSGEGSCFGDGYETSSGFVVDSGGRVFYFWMDPDSDDERGILAVWQEETPDDEWTDDAEYQTARSHLGLPA